MSADPRSLSDRLKTGDSLDVIERGPCGALASVCPIGEVEKLRTVASRLNAQATQLRDERRALEAQLQGAVADVERMRPVYEAACAWSDAAHPVTGGFAGKLHAAVDMARGQ